MIVSELISNSFKHAFPDRATGRILVELRRHNDQVVLTIQDDGIGITPSVIAGQNTSLGMYLVRSLARQIGATLQVAADLGTRIELRWA
ncbi:MAG TPA: sensor histidine kinase [Roseiflexaceae bacterium]|nr:sensor histidine kinase [Roseiflexaceae bacterium]